ncbi:MAG: hypothetical protein R2912_11590 [Eubacteriales bacterium]
MDDEIRALLEGAHLAAAGSADAAATLTEALARVEEMIFREHPHPADDRHANRRGVDKRRPRRRSRILSDRFAARLASQGQSRAAAAAPAAQVDGAVQLPTGFFSIPELTRVFDTLPRRYHVCRRGRHRVRYFSRRTSVYLLQTRRSLGCGSQTAIHRPAMHR